MAEDYALISEADIKALEYQMKKYQRPWNK